MFAYKPLDDYGDERDAVELPWDEWEREARARGLNLTDVIAQAGGDAKSGQEPPPDAEADLTVSGPATWPTARPRPGAMIGRSAPHSDVDRPIVRCPSAEGGHQPTGHRGIAQAERSSQPSRKRSMSPLTTTDMWKSCSSHHCFSRRCEASERRTGIIC